ncbi:tether containing UBX domain for GLUT4-like [Patiria miniata]|uniref:UBX domain-containing protein n=1 Tax=Patiria miniata TaxID=46514 RepID=A0A914AKL7_PATMI|nr:tether containing UBX domain for GLUT4-like [Patiria miniata]
MAATVNVLLPNGRRQNVKVTANTRILQVIENVCGKIGLNPDEYNLKHIRSILDPQLSIRYANLPNNCKLELVKADRPRTESAVFIALQVESGERLQGEFAPPTSLWDILIHWETKNESMTGKLAASSQADDTGKAIHPVCIYLRQEIVGEAWLRATTLKSLGLTGGKAIIRLNHRAVDLPAPPSTQSAKTTPAIKIQQSSQASTCAPQGLPTSVSRGGDDTDTGTSQTSSQESRDTRLTLEVSKTKGAQNKNNSEPQDFQPESLSSDRPEPMDVEETTNASQPTPVGSRSHEGEREKRPQQTQPKQKGVIQQQSPSLELTPEMEQRANMMGAALAEAILKHRTEQQLAQLKQSWSAQPQPQPQYRPQFADFKFPQQPSSQSQPSLSPQQQSSKPPEPCERHPLVFSLDQVTGDPSDTSQDLPDKFFEVTVDDVRRMMADQQLHMSGSEDQHLQTKAMREAKALKKAQQYSQAAVRVHFSDRYVLQGFFRPLETIKALRDFIRGHLQDPGINFYLYTTPPRCILKDDSLSLFKANLFPAAVVHFGSEAAYDHYLRTDLLSEVTSFTKAKEEAASVVRSTSKDGARGTSGSSSSRIGQLGLSSGASTSKASAQGKKDGSSKRQATGEAAANSEKIPKWFKMGKR